MKKIVLAMTLLLTTAAASFGQTAREVLDKAAKNISLESGVKADFRMTSAVGSTSGTIAVKGSKFHATTPEAIMWFDGTTQWTYMRNNDEVSVTTPSSAQLQAINPYNFINLYKSGYKSTMTQTDDGQGYAVHLTATDNSRSVKELFITVSKKSSLPTQVKMLRGKRWTTFDISNLRKQSFDDSTFRFNQKDYPSAEVIDLR